MLGGISNLNERIYQIFPNRKHGQGERYEILRPYCKYINVHGTEYIHIHIATNKRSEELFVTLERQFVSYRRSYQIWHCVCNLLQRNVVLFKFKIEN